MPENLPVYTKEDLGADYSPTSTTFKVWSPVADKMTLRLYRDGNGGNPLAEHEMDKDEFGVWSKDVASDLNKIYYTYQATIGGTLMNEVCDPYAKAVGVNGLRSMVINLASTDPDGWDSDIRPPMKDYNDIILYELHIRDFSIHKSSGIKHKGKYLAFTERGTKVADGTATGLDHLVDLGITHVHLLPAFDFRSIDESKLEANNYNWGYDPQNYNVPEGSYSTDPYHGEVRITEFKQMVQSLHNAGIRVIMDVVYNHTGSTYDSNFDQLVPGYYYRQNQDGSYSDASACGNETASERYMVRKFIKESVSFWAKEYHIDGFRFDLMGIHDLQTMEEVSETLKEIDPTIFVYGEGWAASASPLPDSIRALKKNTHQLTRVAAFSDDLRDAIKGHWSDEKDKGFVSGKTGMEESIKFGIVGATGHPQIDFNKVNYSSKPWANQPWQSINYVSCHDDHTLWDKLTISTGEAEAELIKMQLLANTIVLTSQGVPFLHAGSEFLRTKGGDHNSYKSPDSINAINWERKIKYKAVYEYYKKLISLRKQHPIFKLGSEEQLSKNLKFISSDDGLLTYKLTSTVKDEGWNELFVAFNGEKNGRTITIPAGDWSIVLSGSRFYENTAILPGGDYFLKGTSALILRR